MKLEFTVLETLLVYLAFTNTQGSTDAYWEKERDAESKFLLGEEERKRWGIEYQEAGFTATLPNAGAKTRAEIWQALNAPTVQCDLTRADVEVALVAVRCCGLFGRAERDYVLGLRDKLTGYLNAFRAQEALNMLPREAVIRVAEGMLKG